MLIAVSATELVRILSSVDRNFAEVDDLAPSLPGLTQRLDEIIKIQFDTREQGEVSEFDFIGSIGFVLVLTVGTELWNCTTVLRKKAGNSHAAVLGQRNPPLLNTQLMSFSVRYISCLMLQIASIPKDKRSQFRIFQTFLKACKFCLGTCSTESF